MNEMRELDETELEQVEGGTFMEDFLDSWFGAMSGGYVGYSGGQVTYGNTYTAYKNAPGGP